VAPGKSARVYRSVVMGALLVSAACSATKPLTNEPAVALTPAPQAPPALEPSQLGPDAWPTTCDAAAQDAVEWLSTEARETLRSTPREDLIQFHFGLGMGIRNRQGLWRGNVALIESCLGTVGHPDDASMVILEKARALLQAPQ
jgi:hypothetical protein